MKIASFQTMQEKENVIVIGGGPSFDFVINKVIKLKEELSALIIGIHWGFKHIRPDYTLFITPGKFREAQDKLPGHFLLGPRIKSINKKNRKRSLGIKYGQKLALWDGYDFLEKNEILFSACGFEAIMLACFCKPKNIAIVGFDGFEVKNNKLVVRHSVSSTAPRALITFNSEVQKKRDIKMEQKRCEDLARLINYITNQKKINFYVFEKDRLKGLDKSKFKDNQRFFVL
jgi:hypothetical protein